MSVSMIVLLSNGFYIQQIHNRKEISEIITENDEC